MCSRWMLLSLLLSFAVAIPVHSAALGIGVDVAIEVTPLNFLKSEEEGALKRTREELTFLFAEQFPHWDFTTDLAVVNHVLRLHIVEEVKNEILLRLEFRGGEFGSLDWAEVWLSPGDLSLQGYPVSEREFLKSLLHTMHETLLKKRRLEIIESLKRVPIGIGAKWIEPEISSTASGSREYRMVLALKWERHKPLRESSFLVSCTWPKKGMTYLYSTGVGLSKPYRFKDGSHSALVAKPEKRQYAGSIMPFSSVREEALKLKMKEIFLREYCAPPCLQIYD